MSRSALVIGASRGLGLALAEALVAQGWTVTATVRDDAGAARLAARGIGAERLDVTDAAGIDALAARIPAGSLDLLFVNAGISGDRGAAIGAVPADKFAEVMRVNAHAPLVVLDRLHGALAENGTAAVMSSMLGSIADNRVGTWETYRMSKAALNMGLRSLALRIGGPRQAFVAVAPGWVRTEMGGPEAALSIDESIPGVVAMLDGVAGQGGTHFLDYKAETLRW